jgi:hypothetical protein
MLALMLWLFLVTVVEQVLEAQEELLVKVLLMPVRREVQEVQQVQLELQEVQQELLVVRAQLDKHGILLTLQVVEVVLAGLDPEMLGMVVREVIRRLLEVEVEAEVEQREVMVAQLKMLQV